MSGEIAVHRHHRASAVSFGVLRGTCWGQVDPSLLERLCTWARNGPDAECIEFKPGRVWRWRDVVVKWFHDDLRVRIGLRSATAFRASAAAMAMPAGSAARPIAAFKVSRSSSVLVSEFVSGGDMYHAWQCDDRCIESFGVLMACLHSRGIHHGDLHPGNLIWTGDHWVLLDLESLRHRLRNLNPRRQAIAQWARVYVKLKRDPRVRDAFHVYCGLTRRRWETGADWDEIVRGTAS